MKRSDRAIALVMSALIAGGSLLLATRAEAGPARYDPQTRSFRFTYTFAEMPGSPNSFPGAVQKPTVEQQEKVKVLVGRVSRVIEQITNGMARIGTLDYVENVRDADLIISLTGQPSSAGWAHLGAIEGNPGRIALYYRTLEPQIEQDVVLTVAHELGHYLFGLDDMYDRSKYPNGCPVGLDKPGSLMDNFLSGARGWMGRLDNADEWRAAIRRGMESRSQGKSSQEIVDEFFRKRGADPSSTTPPPATGTPTDDATRSIVTAAIGKTRVEALNQIEQNRTTSSSRLVRFARELLESLRDQFNKNNPTKIFLTRDRLDKLADEVAKAGAIVPVPKPKSLPASIFEAIKSAALQFGRQYLSETRDSTRFRRIRSDLSSFVDQFLEQNQVDAEAFDGDARRDLVERLSRLASAPEEYGLQRLNDLSEIAVQYDREIADAILRVLDAQEEPGTLQARERIRRLNVQLDNLAVPGRDYFGFGGKRARFINPDSPDRVFDFVQTQAGVFPYSEIRNRGFNQFANLIDRGRIQLEEPRFQIEERLRSEATAVRVERPLDSISDAANREAIRRDRASDFQTIINNLESELKRDRLENVALLVPPGLNGGLPTELVSPLQRLDERLPAGIDVRLDTVLVGSTTIPAELRKLVMRSGGSILTVSDLDEIGAIAQRLKNEQGSGSWIIIPQQGTIPVDAKLPVKPTMSKEQTAAVVEGVQEIAAGFRSEMKETDTTTTRLAKERATDSLTLLHAALTEVQGNDYTSYSESIRMIGTARVKLEQTRAVLGDVWSLLLATSANKGIQNLKSNSESRIGADFELVEQVVIDFERTLEQHLLASGARLPLYMRIHRQAQEQARIRSEETAEGRHPLQGLVAGLGGPKNHLGLARFHAENTVFKPEPGSEQSYDLTRNQAYIELVVGLSRPLPSLKQPDGPDKPPTLSLYNKQGQPVRNSVPLDRSLSTSSMLVYRFEGTEALPADWYYPVLSIGEKTFDLIEKNPLNFTFSVASTRPNIFVTGKAMEGASGTPSPDGIYKRNEGFVAVECEFNAGSPVRKADVLGFVQRIDEGKEPISPEVVQFFDDGRIDPRSQLRDRKADDGIYTGFVEIRGDLQQPTEFRVSIQATTSPESRFIELDNPMAADPKANDENVLQPPTSLSRLAADPAALVEDTARAQNRGGKEADEFLFQRATTVHFLVEP